MPDLPCKIQQKNTPRFRHPLSGLIDNMEVQEPVTAPEPEIALDYVKKGDEKFKKQDFSGALADYTNALEINPAFVKAYRKRGLIRYLQGDLQDAEAEWESAWEWECKK
jgi:tetratricopeptide (TPR) repeat protein